MNNTRRILQPALLAALLVVGLSHAAAANERHFTNTYESAVLPPDVRELEVTSTPSFGRDNFYGHFDERAEFEVGITDAVQSSLYLNFDSTTADAADGTRTSDVHFGGISNEWKWQLSDPVADPLGFALYAELTGAPDAAEVETKLIFDKRVGNVLFAANLVGAHEAKFGAEASENELELKADLGLVYFFSHAFCAGLEAESHNVFPDYDQLEYSALTAGPTMAYASDGWWVALSVFPQLPAPYLADGGTFELSDHARISGRIIVSFQL